MSTITIVDYGMGNLRSVAKAVEKIGHQAQVTTDPQVIAQADRLILPGVGAFRDAIARLRETGLDDSIRSFLLRSRPFLGICLGLQLLFDTSYEDGEYPGLGILAGDVVRFDPPPIPDSPPLKVPHMGWNQIDIVHPTPLLADLPTSPSVYFVHSYYVRPADPSVVATTTDYGQRFVSMVAKDNLAATQFHPEKSQRTGLALLANFAAS
jgi:glutamine amidotransferase